MENIVGKIAVKIYAITFPVYFSIGDKMLTVTSQNIDIFPTDNYHSPITQFKDMAKRKNMKTDV